MNTIETRKLIDKEIGRQKFCVLCGKAFYDKSKRGNRKYCDNECSKKAQREISRKWQQNKRKQREKVIQ